MRYFLYICLLSILTFSCDDGDVFEVELEFDQELERCGDDESDNYVLYDTRTDPSESLTLLFPVNVSTRVYFNPDNNTGDPFDLTINGTTVTFNYRTYDGVAENLICQDIPIPGTTITNDYEAESGAIARFVSTYEDDDNDGIPSEFEGRGAQAEDGSYPDAIDTDGDGLPDYVDEDDDNDNILTSAENPNYDDTDGLENAQDTDGDGTPDYLDNDDDDDGVLTRNEDEDGDLSPLDDFDESNGVNTTPRYLDDNATDEYIQDAFIVTEFSRNVEVQVTILNANIDILSVDEIFLGTYSVPTLTLTEL
ncbi:hypothetical protein [Psychroserpens sp. SPM9]|uniref:hypothetical protein n=1 Tax=Psychroserpens sp. SPM9 TaxID=2975598 RepID=UPI0021A34C4C|nr:hypothetical protein [Psychroserpens sp. SPM9]MDG5491407.1 hypothetical protein [Psychroserpens sp. SPM9]